MTSPADLSNPAPTIADPNLPSIHHHAKRVVAQSGQLPLWGARDADQRAVLIAQPEPTARRGWQRRAGRNSAVGAGELRYAAHLIRLAGGLQHRDPGAVHAQAA